MTKLDPLVKSVAMRFVRAFLAGAVASMALILFTGNGWREIGVWLNGLAMAGVVGGISAVLMAADKWFRNTRKK